MIRQEYRRMVTGQPPPPPGTLFANITRTSADEGMMECVKYLFNYGFFKFGVEICLMSLVGVIGTRLDLYSVFYTVWLCYFFNRRREEIYKVWHWFIYFITFMIPIQYLMCVGMPPTVCLADFCLLVFAVCQQKAFAIEFSDDAESYDGGSNHEIVYDDMTNLVNPIPDFITYNRTVLDKVKSVIFFSSYWVTLAVMFLSGTNRTTLFAMGYVLCAFVFLWQGNEFYLRPLSTILRLITIN
ncbi:Piezo-type mechanosensitive ion channel component [Armadillidium vulgare]|nr:Piezo-type mechanosensitive ion channel component [Armadillidium vulgare]